jgi:hypothetical protein
VSKHIPVVGGAPDPMDGTSCRDEMQSALPSSESEGTKHNVIMIPESDERTWATRQREEHVV